MKVCLTSKFKAMNQRIRTKLSFIFMEIVKISLKACNWQTQFLPQPKSPLIWLSIQITEVMFQTNLMTSPNELNRTIMNSLGKSSNLLRHLKWKFMWSEDQLDQALPVISHQSLIAKNLFWSLLLIAYLKLQSKK